MADELTRQKLFAKMSIWNKFIRRHEDNIFNALFFDKEDFCAEEIDGFVHDTAMFFDVTLPQVYDDCETLAKEISRSGSDYDIYYNERLLRDAGINNKDAFKLMLTHEVCHHVFRNVVFGLIENERWTHELICDYMAAVRAVMNGFATGKYLYTIRESKGSRSHPPGWIRKPAFVQGWKSVESLLNENVKFNVHHLIGNFKEFVMYNKDVIDNEWRNIDAHIDDPKPEPKETRIEDLPDSNLIKRYVMYGKTGLQ